MTRSDVGLGGGVTHQLRGHFVPDGQWRKGREKRVVDNQVARTKTDTGRRGEYPQALERTAVKELGKITP
jgi:hypothetical protein